MKLGRNYSGPKPHLPWPKQPTPKIGRNDPGWNDLEPTYQYTDKQKTQRDLYLKFKQAQEIVRVSEMNDDYPFRQGLNRCLSGDKKKGKK